MSWGQVWLTCLDSLDAFLAILAQVVCLTGGFFFSFSATDAAMDARLDGGGPWRPKGQGTGGQGRPFTHAGGWLWFGGGPNQLADPDAALTTVTQLR